MAVPKRSVTYFNFTGGLNTEATPLSREPNDATDLSNVDISLDGSVERRNGIDFIASKSDGSYYSTSTFDYTSTRPVYTDEVPSAIVFKPQKTDGTSFSVVVAHIGTEFRIYDYNHILDLVESPRQVISLASTGEAKQVHYRTQFAADRNRLYFVNKHLPFGYIEYDPDENHFSVVQQNLLVRSLSGDAFIDARVNHRGKNYQAIRAHAATKETEPGVGDVWEQSWIQLGPELTGDDAWSQSTGGGSTVNVTLTIGGNTYDETYQCILDHTSSLSDNHPKSTSGATYWKQIQTITGVPQWEEGVEYTDDAAAAIDYASNVTILDNFGKTSTAFASGRLWVSGVVDGANKVFFSQTIEEDHHYNRMFQEADPFSDIDSAVVDTDGGSIVVVGADRIISLQAFQGGILAFADNGVWYIRGSGGVFRATDFSVDKVSTDGAISNESIATIDDKIVYFGYSNAYVIAAQDIDILPSTVPITEKISSFYSSIPLPNREMGKAIYNGSEKKLYFFTNFGIHDWTIERNPYAQATHMRDVLVFDTRLQAWYTYSLPEDTVGDKVSIGDVFNLRAGKSLFTTVINNNGDLVEDESGNLVESFDTTNSDLEIKTIPLFIKRNGDNTDYAFGTLEGGFFQDFALNDVDAESFDSYIETAHQVMNDVSHKKQTPYIITLFDRVESGVIDETTGEDITPGGCLMSVFYNFSTSAKSAKYGAARQAYKPTRWNISYYDGSDPGLEVVRNKHKIRGRGDAFQLRFENDGDKDFKLYGFQIDITSSRKV